MNICKHFLLGIMCCVVSMHLHAKVFLDSVDGYPSEIPQEWLHTIPCLTVAAAHTLVPKKIEIVDILKKALEELHNCGCNNASYDDKIQVWQKVFEQAERHQWEEVYQAAWHVGFNAYNKNESGRADAQEILVDGLARAFAVRMIHAKKGEIIEVAPFDDLIPGFWKRIGKQSKLLPRS